MAELNKNFHVDFNFLKNEINFDPNSNYDDNKIYKTLFSRDNYFLMLAKQMSENNFDSIEIKIINEKAKLILFNSDSPKDILEDRPKDFKTVISKLIDLHILDNELTEFEDLSKTNINRLDGKKFNVSSAIEHYRKLMDEHSKTNEVYNFIKKLTNDSKYYEGAKSEHMRMRGPVYAVIYKELKRLELVKNSESLNKLTYSETSQTKYESLEKILDIFFKKTNCITNMNKFEMDSEPHVLISELDRVSGITVKNLKYYIESGETFIPIFQRNYVWGYKQIISLMNSILDDFPIGSVIMAKTNLSIQPKNPIVQCLHNTNSKAKNERYMILDGQQRTTSIILMYMFNEMHHHAGNFDKDLANLVEEIKNKTYFYENKLMTIDKIQKIFKDNGKEGFEDYKFYNPNDWSVREKFTEKIGKYKLSIITESSSDTNRLIKIFDNINKGGTKLSHIDLLNAQIYNIIHANDKYNFDLLEKLQEIRNDSYIKRFKISNDLIIQLWALLTFATKLEKSKVVINGKEIILTPNNWKEKKWKEHNISKERIVRIGASETESLLLIDNYNNIKKVLAYTIKILEEIGIPDKKSLPSIAHLICIGGIVIKHLIKNNDELKLGRNSKINTFMKSDDFKNVMNMLIQTTTKGDYSAGTANKAFANLIEIFNDSYKPLDYNKVKEIIIRYKDDVSYKDDKALYKLFISYLITNNPAKLFEDKLINSVGDEFTSKVFDQHHIIPVNSKHAKKINDDKLINNIGNIMICDPEENKKFKNLSPYEYLSKEFLADENSQISRDYFKRAMKSHIINEKFALYCFDQKFNNFNEWINKDKAARLFKYRERLIIKGLLKLYLLK